MRSFNSFGINLEEYKPGIFPRKRDTAQPKKIYVDQ